MAANKKTQGEMSEFESKLLSRLKAANKRAQGVEAIEDLRPQVTLRRVKLHLEPRSISGEEIKKIRHSFKISQAVFALFIQVPVRTLQEWEQGRSEIPGCAARLLGEMIHNPNYWQERLKDSFETANN